MSLPAPRGQARLHIELDSSKIQAGFRGPFGDCGNARPFDAAVGFWAGMRKVWGQPGHDMVNRFMTAQSTVATRRRWRLSAILMLAAMASLAALTANAATREARPGPTTEARAPREAGEPIMAIVSIKSQQVTFYDADGWIVRAPVSTGTTGRETPAGVFAILEKDKDHHSTLYDDAWMPNMQRITWNGIALHGEPA